MSKLALLGGSQIITNQNEELFLWPIVTPEMEEAVLEVLRKRKISSMDITVEFEKEYAEWLGVKYALAHNNGTSAIHSSLFGLGIGRGDEVICPNMTYWASCVPVFSLGGTVVLADIDPDTLCIDPQDIERRITKRTKAIVVVHYSGVPADMDVIIALARKRNITVLEDCSHSHGSLYKGQMTGTFGEVAGFSLTSVKSFPIGEGGMLATNDRQIYERAIAFSHYARHNDFLTLPDLKTGAGVPWGGYKYRLNQLCSAIGRVQLKSYPEQMAEIDRAMNAFWDMLEGVPGIRSHRPSEGSGNTKGGWYNPLGHYNRDELGGLSITRFCAAVQAEGVTACEPGCNIALQTHSLFNTLDVYGDGKPTILVNAHPETDPRQDPQTLPVSTGIQAKMFQVPWFKKLDPEAIKPFAAAFRKVAECYEELLPEDPGDPEQIGTWGTSTLTVKR